MGDKVKMAISYYSIKCIYYLFFWMFDYQSMQKRGRGRREPRGMREMPSHNHPFDYG